MAGIADITDTSLERAASQVRRVRSGALDAPLVEGFFDHATFTISYVVSDPKARKGAIIDSVWDFDQPSGRTQFRSADAIVEHVRKAQIEVDWILETHAHADHLSAAAYLKTKLGGAVGIGREIVTVQGVFAKIFNEGTDFARDGSQFDRLIDDGDQLTIGNIPLTALHVPGHTPADMAYLIGDALFVGDTMFMPDYGTARADFPGGDAAILYRSVRRLMRLPDETRVFLCHDYLAPGRERYEWETTIRAERTGNVHIHDGVSEEAFVAMRNERDRTLDMPRLILPSLQVNIRAGHLPEPDDNGVSYLRLPVDLL